MGAVLVLVEHGAEGVDELSLQALSLARDLAGEEPLTALLVGPGGREAAGGLGAYGVATAHLAEDERLAAYAPGAWARSVTELIESAAPERGRGRGHEPRQRGAGPRGRAPRPALRRELHRRTPG